MSKKVLDALTVKYSKVQEGVGKIMGGKILDYEAKDILNRGKVEKLREQVEKKVKKGLSIAEIADMLEESEKTIEKIVKGL